MHRLKKSTKRSVAGIVIYTSPDWLERLLDEVHNLCRETAIILA